MGWSLPIPMISVDTSEGRTRQIRYQVGSARLVRVDEPDAMGGVETYRADGDKGYTRYEKWPDGTEAGFWVARSFDGTVTTYGGAPSSRDERVEGTQGDSLYGGQGRWFVSSVVDARGNRIDYQYQTVLGAARNSEVVNSPIDIVPVAIEYGKNDNDATTENHARIELAWQASLSTCPDSNVPIGSQLTYRTGIRRYEGAKKLLAIRAYVKTTPGSSWQKRREFGIAFAAETAGERTVEGLGSRRPGERAQRRLAEDEVRLRSAGVRASVRVEHEHHGDLHRQESAQPVQAGWVADARQRADGHRR
jgi:hypothetical protein